MGNMMTIDDLLIAIENEFPPENVAPAIASAQSVISMALAVGIPMMDSKAIGPKVVMHRILLLVKEYVWQTQAAIDNQKKRERNAANAADKVISGLK